MDIVSSYRDCYATAAFDHFCRAPFVGLRLRQCQDSPIVSGLLFAYRYFYSCLLPCHYSGGRETPAFRRGSGCRTLFLFFHDYRALSFRCLFSTDLSAANATTLTIRKATAPNVVYCLMTPA